MRVEDNLKGVMETTDKLLLIRTYIRLKNMHSHKILWYFIILKLYKEGFISPVRLINRVTNVK